MDAKRAFRWAGYYFLFAAVGTLVGYGIAAGGLALALPDAYQTWTATQSLAAAGKAGAPGFALAVVGLLVRKFVRGWALFKTLTGAVGEETAESFDDERLKSEILSVLDDRLSDMQSELREIHRDLPDDDLGNGGGGR